MRRSEEEGVRRLLGLGWRLLRSGQAREAGDAFGRVLLRRPGQTEARRGAAKAQQAAAELARLAEGEPSSPTRRSPRALATLSPQSSPATKRRQRVEEARHARPTQTPSRVRRGGTRAAVWGRRVFLASACGVLALALAIVTLRWTTLMEGMSRPPSPASAERAPVAAPDAPSAGQQILVEAHRRIEGGDAPAARVLLRSIGPEDPAYPFAQRLQLELPRRGEQP